MYGCAIAGAVVAQSLFVYLMAEPADTGIPNYGGPWDFKPGLRKAMGLGNEFYGGLDEGNSCSTDTGQFFAFGDSALPYDIFGNVAFGYLAASTGLDENIINFGNNIPFFAGNTGERDDIFTRLGINLWKEHGTDLTKDVLDRAIKDTIYMHKDNEALDWQKNQAHFDK